MSVTLFNRLQSIRSFFLRVVIWYQHIFSGSVPTCRFYPSCSSYARESLELHGTWRGLWLTSRRLLRCRPFGPYGVDPVPAPQSSTRKPDSVIPSTDHHDADESPER